jgi:tRNA-specific 2-thiouridylase
MRLHDAADRVDGGRKSCCTLDAADDARRVADQLKIPFHIQNLEREFADAVLEPFVGAYLGGETPSPCVGCNTAVKFGALVGKGSALFGCETVAPGACVPLWITTKTRRISCMASAARRSLGRASHLGG